MTHETPHDPKRELEDRLVDLAMREVVGNETPPADTNLHSSTPASEAVSTRPHHDAGNRRRTGYIIAASSAACLALVALLAIGQANPSRSDVVAVSDDTKSVLGPTKPSPQRLWFAAGVNADGLIRTPDAPGEPFGGEFEGRAVLADDVDSLRTMNSVTDAISDPSSDDLFANGFGRNTSQQQQPANRLLHLAVPESNFERPRILSREETLLEGHVDGMDLGGRNPVRQTEYFYDEAPRSGNGQPAPADPTASPPVVTGTVASNERRFTEGQSGEGERQPPLEPAPTKPSDVFGLAPSNVTRAGESADKDEQSKAFSDFSDIARVREKLASNEDKNIWRMLPLAVDARRKQAVQYSENRESVTRDIEDLKRVIDLPAQRGKESQLAEQLQELVATQGRLNEAEKKLEEEIEQLGKLASELDFKEVMSTGNRRLSGTVLGSNDLGLVTVELEGDEQAVVGQGIDLYAQDQYWGRIAVEEVADGKLVGQIVSKVDGRPLPVGAKATGDLKKSPIARKTWRRAKAGPNASRLVIGDRDELPPQGVQANVMIDGFRARVVLDYYFFNDREQSLEGAFKVRLPNDASLFYFAFGETRHEYQPSVDSLVSAGLLDGESMKSTEFDAAGILATRSESLSSVKEARIVPREKAAYAYQDMTRKQIDPALVEWSGAGMFNARVFPLAANKLHRIVVGYDVNLTHDESDLIYQLDLPTDMGELHVDLNVAAGPEWKTTIKPAAEPATINGRSYYHFKDPAGEKLELRFQKPGATLLTGTENETGDYFAFEATPEFPANEERVGASHGLFLVDTSLSNNAERFNRHLDLMVAALDKNREQLTHFNTLFFNVETHWWKPAFVANTPANVSKLRRHCESLTLEGATDLRAALKEAAKPLWAEANSPPADLFLLSDGAATWGETNLHLIGKELQSPTVGSLFAYKTAIAGEASDALHHLARLTGGALFSIANEEEIAAAATAHRQRPWKLESVAMAGGSDVLIAGRPEVIYPGQRLLVVGRGQPKLSSELVLAVQRGNEKKQVRMAVDQVVKSDLTPRLYGFIAVGQLEDWLPATRTFSEAFARHFRVAGQSCSLLMLETEDDYLKYDIKPEEDAFVVKSTPADTFIEKTIRDLGQELEDPKAATKQLLKLLGEVPGFRLEMPAALMIAMDQMPVDSFAVSPEPLVCELRARAAMSDAFVSLLTTQRTELPYDEVVAEAKRRFGVYGAGDGLKALSSLVENNPGDVVLLRDVGYTAMQWKRGDQAVALLKRAAVARPFEPQGWLALAQSLASMDRADLAIVYYELVLAGQWDGRFGEIHRIAAVDYLRFLRQIDAGKTSCNVTDFAHSRMTTLGKKFDMQGADLLVTLAWNTDRTDVDLHILEPTGEKCSYENTDTKIGGHITSDVTGGYGPEMYTLPNARHGDYEIAIHYFGADRIRVSTRTKVTISVYRNFGEPGEQVFRETVSLSDEDQTIVVKKLRIEK